MSFPPGSCVQCACGAFRCAQTQQTEATANNWALEFPVQRAVTHFYFCKTAAAALTGDVTLCTALHNWPAGCFSSNQCRSDMCNNSCNLARMNQQLLKRRQQTPLQNTEPRFQLSIASYSLKLFCLLSHCASKSRSTKLSTFSFDKSQLLPQSWCLPELESWDHYCPPPFNRLITSCHEPD